MPLFAKKSSNVAEPTQAVVRRQSADRTPSRQQSISSVHSATSSHRRASAGSQHHAHTHVHDEYAQGPRPVQVPQGQQPRRVGIPKAAFEKPKPANPNGTVPAESRTVGDHVKDACAYCGLAYAGCTTIATYPAAAAGGAAGWAAGFGCGFLKCGLCCIPACLGCYRPDKNKKKTPWTRGGAAFTSNVVGCGLCLPCITPPSLNRLQKSGKMSEEQVRKATNIVYPWVPCAKAAGMDL